MHGLARDSKEALGPTSTTYVAIIMLGKFVEVWDVRVSFGVIVGVFGVIVIAAIVIAAVVYVRKRMQKP